MNTLLKLIAFMFSFVFMVSCDRKNDFDMVCSYFDLLVSESDIKKLTPDQKYIYINDLVNKNISHDSSARESWKAVVGYVPSAGRYTLYKEAAEATIKKDWQCDSMRDLLKDM